MEPIDILILLGGVIVGQLLVIFIFVLLIYVGVIE
jgi:hypothetical protein